MIHLHDLLAKWQQSHPDMLPYDSKAFRESLMPENKQNYTLAIKVLAFLGACIAALMFFVVLFIAEVFRSKTGILGIGLICSISSLVISNQIKYRHVMLDPIVIVLGIIGQCMTPWGIVETSNFNKSAISIYAVVLVIAIVFLFFSKNAILRYAATVTIPLAFMAICWELKFFDGVHIIVAFVSVLFVLIWQKEAFILSQYSFFTSYFGAVSFGLLTTLILTLSATINRSFHENFFVNWWISTLILIVLTLYEIIQTLRKLSLQKWIIPLSIVTIVVLAPTLYAPGIAASVLILLVGFRVGYMLISVIGVLSLIYFMVAFYYNLNTTLLWKSIFLMTSGILFLGIFFGFKKISKI